MPNIHAINAQGTEYGITAENGITQAQSEKIETIGDVSDLVTTEKANTVGAINELATALTGIKIKSVRKLSVNIEVEGDGSEEDIDITTISKNGTYLIFAQADNASGVIASRLSVEVNSLQSNRVQANGGGCIQCFMIHTVNNGDTVTIHGAWSSQGYVKFTVVLVELG